MKRLYFKVTGLVLGIALAAPGMAQDGAADASDKREQATEILRQMLPPDVAEGMSTAQPMTGFGSEMSRLAFENAYMQLWTRPGLTLRERSMVTIALLIGQGNEHELEIHMDSGLRNGVTHEQLEEVIYHATAYAGFPKAADALTIAHRVVSKEREIAVAGQ